MFPIVIAQLNPTVGDISGNAELISNTLQSVQEKHDNALVIFPEMMLSGYCPQDLLLRPDFINQCAQTLQTLAKKTQQITAIIGSPYPIKESPQQDINDHKAAIMNAAIVCQEGEIKHIYAKQQLPNYAIFDEQRYFTKQPTNCIIEHQNKKIGLLVCEDGWKKASYQQFVTQKVDLIISINASPFEQNKPQQRLDIVKKINHITNTPVIYANLMGAQDELIFDGGSFILTEADTYTALPQFTAGAFVIELNNNQVNITDTIAIAHTQASDCLPQNTQYTEHTQFTEHSDPSSTLWQSPHQQLYNALQLGLRDYVVKNQFPKVLLGLSGGIDSALTCALAADALGKERVISVMLASPYTSQMSIDLAQEQANLLGIEHHCLALEESMHSIENTLLPIWQNLPDKKAISRQNIQARLRGLLLMALSNEYNALLLATGNKSELAVGYATLYGDMAGGYSPIKDLYKTQVYALSEYRNAISQAIPQQVIERPPTAELAPNQKDTDSLPEYAILDAILELFIEQKCSATQIAQQGYEPHTIEKVIRMVLKNQHKRQQASIGTKVTSTAFGRDYRYPNTQKWH